MPWGTRKSEPMDRILLWAVQSQGQWRSTSTELSPERYRGRSPRPSQGSGGYITIIVEREAEVDNIQTELVQAGRKDVITALTTVSNKIRRTGNQSLVITLPKISYLQQCQNYRTISLISHPSKVRLKIILNRFKLQADKIIAEELAGFRAGRSTEKISHQRILYEKYLQPRTFS